MIRSHRMIPCRPLSVLLALGLAAATAAIAPEVGAQESYQRISGEGSTWSAGAIDAMRVNVKQFGITVDYNPSGSSAGRKNWLNGTVDFAASDIPFQFRPEDGSAPERPEAGSYAYIPVTAGGTAFMYNLKINGQRVTNLRLSGENVAKIFTAQIRKWNDPALQADNPGLTLPDRNIVPVVRSDGSGSSAQFTRWMIRQHGGVWQDYCERSGRAPACGFTSFYPTVSGMIAQSGDLGVAGYVAQNFAEGAIGYVNYSYALGSQFPVVKVLNTAGYYTEPTPENVAVSLLKARINTDEASDEYLTQILDDVYSDQDPRNYQLSSYSYFILPTKVRGQFNEKKGRTLGAFTYYAMCQAQQQSASLGYSPIPINLVEASFEQIRKIPGAEVQNINIQQCKNPTFSPSGENLLAKNAPRPQECDRRGPSQCAAGSGGVKNQPTPVKPSAGGGQGPSAGGGGGATGGAGAVGGGGSGGAGTTGGGTGVGGAVSSGGGSAAGSDGSAGGATADGSGGAVVVDEFGVPVAADEFGTPLTSGSGEEFALDTTSAGGGASPTSTVLGGASGWSSSQVLILLIGLLTLTLVGGPPLLLRRLSEDRVYVGSLRDGAQP